MAVSLTHSFTSAVADGGDTTLVRPVDWNDEHVLELATDKLLGRDTASAGPVEEIGLNATLEFDGAGNVQRAALTGDVTASAGSNSTTIANDAVSFAKMQNIATDSLIGRDSGGTGDPENILLNATLSMDGAGNLQRAALTGDVTASAGSNSTTIANDAVTYAKMQDISATARILGRKTSGAGDTEECTLSEVMDFVGSAAQGDILYRGAATWTRLGAGTDGQFLKTQGAAANPIWADAGGSWTSIDTDTTSGTPTTITFDNIPGTYKELLLVGTISGSGTGALRLAVSTDNGSSYSGTGTLLSTTTAANDHPIRLCFIGYTLDRSIVLARAGTSGEGASPAIYSSAVNEFGTVNTGGIDAFQLSLASGNFDAWDLTLYAR